MDMKSAYVEKSLVVVLFVLVTIVFSFAERDTKRVNERFINGTAVKPYNEHGRKFAVETQPMASEALTSRH